ncbi:MAG: hypothetical protein ACRYGO_08015 [Janthinobacterium lividum]
MTRHHARRAIIVLEAPWELDDKDANRTSVLPFIEGVAKLAGDTEVLHANFYDGSSFAYALKCLCKTQYQNAIVYIAAHGWKGQVGKVPLGELLRAIANVSKACNITGVLLGSCYGGECSQTMEDGLKASNMRWCVGYASSSWWLEGTLIDCSILAKMASVRRLSYRRQAKMIEHFADAIAQFAPTYPIGEDMDDDPVMLQDSLTFVVQIDGKGQQPQNVSAEVFGRRGEFLIDDEDDEDEEDGDEDDDE